MKYLITILLLGSSIPGFTQNIDFEEPNLQAYLLEKECVDLNGDGTYDSTADLDQNGSISHAEALAIKHLEIDDLYREYYIRHIQDIRHFENLESLLIYSNDSLEYISLLGLDSLHTLRLDGSPYSLKYFDISDLPNVRDLRVEGPFYMDYFNIQNGTYADEYFSLFYTEYIQYACVDDIQEEINIVAEHMDVGLSPQTECSVSINEAEKITAGIFPNPAKNTLHINYETPPESIQIIDIKGRIIVKPIASNINITDLASGMYYLELRFKNKVTHHSFMKE